MKWKRPAWLAAVVLVALLGAAAWQSVRPKYLRYISAPLKDGTRYTFLYPPHFDRVIASGPYVMMDSVPAPSLLDSLRERLSGTPGLKFLRQGHSSIWVTGGIKLSEARVPRRSHSTEASRYTVLHDARSGLFFSLMHTDRTLQPAAFASEAHAVSDSFQIVPPGAPVPSP